MPLTRYQIRNEFSLADPELYKAADKDDPEALLEGIAMAGLVGVLRQLGDLAEFAAEIFHDLHEEVMATAARGHGLMARVQQLEAEFPSIEKAFLCQTNHSLFFTNAGVDWHPNLRTEHNLINRGDLPRCVLDSYEECRGPPRLFLLDKFDVAGAGACLKRYTDPSFFKAESDFPELAPIEVQREKKARKVKKKGSRWRNGETPEVAPTSHAKLHQLLLEERIENAYNDPTRLVKLKRRQLNGSPLESKSGKSYMEKFLQSPSPEHKAVYETFDTPPLSKMIPDNSIESGLEIFEISAVSPTKHCSQGKENLSSSPDAQVALRSYMEELNGEVIDREVVKMPETTADFSNGIEKDILVDGECSIDGDHSDDMISEVDNYTDALTTVGSELDTDNEYRPKNDIGILDIGKYQTDSDINEQKVKVQAHTSDSHSVGISSLSDDGNSSFKKGRSSCSNSDTIDNMTEDMPSNGEVAAKAYPTNKNCVEIVEGQYIQLPAYAEMQCSTSDKALLPKDTFFGECIIPDLGGAFYGSYLDDLNSTHVKLDEAASQMPISLAEPQLDEVLHEDVKTNSGMSDRDGGKDVIDSSEDTFADSCEKRETTLITWSAESHHVDGLGTRETKVSFSSHDLSHSSNALLVVPEKSSNDSLDEVSKTGSATESCAGSSVHQIQIFGLSNSDILPAEEQLPHSTLPEVERSSAITQSPEGLDVMLPVNFAPEGNDVTLEAVVNSDCMTPMVGTSQTCGFNERQLSGISHDDRQLEGDSIEEVASYIECKQTVEQPFDVAKAEETCRVKTVEEDIVLCNLPSSFAHNLELDNHLGLDDLATENFYAEGIAVSAAASVSADFDDDYVDDTNFSSSTLIFSPSSNLKNLQEPLFGAGDQFQGGLESNEVIFQECLKESNVKDVRNQVGGIPADVDSSEDKLATFDSFNLEDDIQYSLADPTKNILNLSKVPASSELSDQELEPKYPSYLMESRSDVVSSPSGYLSEKETALEQSLDLHNDQHDEESLLLAEDISNSLNILYGQIQSWYNIDQERCCQTSSAHSVEGSSSQPTLEVSQQSDLQANQEMFPSDSAQPSLGLLHEATKVSLEEMPPLPPLPPMQWRTGKVQHASPASQRELAEHGQGSFPMIPAYATEQKAHFGLSALEQGIEQPRNPFLSIINGELSSCNVPNQLVTDVSYPDTFPVHQSRMGNGANSQCDGIDLDGTNPSPNPNPNPILTLPTVTNESLEYSSVVMESDGVEFSHSLVPMLGTEYTNPRLFPLCSQEKTEHAPNQFVPDTEGAEFQDSKQKSERENGNPDISVGQPAKTEEQSPTKLAEEVPTEAVEQFPAKVEEQPQHDLPSIERKTALASNPIFLLGLAAAEGETTQTSNTNLRHNFSTPEGEAARPPHTLALLPVIEDGSTDGNPSIKPPRPRNPLIDAVAAHDKSKMRKATERFQPPTIPKVEERDSLLEQIRNKSFNLKPAAVTRPSIQGPKTNLRVAAILEKANAIRQALAGSDEDEDEDEDGWSDS